MTGQLLGLVDRLLQTKLRFIIIGGHAVNAHGYARATEDIDLVWERTTESEVRLFEQLQNVGAFWIGDQIDPATGIELTHPINILYVRTQRLMMLGTDLGYVDLFDHVPSMSGLSVPEAIQRCHWYLGRPYVNLADLRAMKAAVGRTVDLEDLRNLPLPRD